VESKLVHNTYPLKISPIMKFRYSLMESLPLCHPKKMHNVWSLQFIYFTNPNQSLWVMHLLTRPEVQSAFTWSKPSIIELSSEMHGRYLILSKYDR